MIGDRHTISNVTGSDRAACLFCGSSENKLSREHVLRDKFKLKYPATSKSTFVAERGDVRRFDTIPVSQFDFVVRQVCKPCNEGWLNDMENAVEPAINLLSGTKLPVPIRVDALGPWAVSRALLRTYTVPALEARAPLDLFRTLHRTRSVPAGCFVRVVWVDAYTFPAGSVATSSGNDGAYVGQVSFGLGPLLFVVNIGYGSSVAVGAAEEIWSKPAEWFPESTMSIHPLNERQRWSPTYLSGDDRFIAGCAQDIVFKRPIVLAPGRVVDASGYH